MRIDAGPDGMPQIRVDRVASRSDTLERLASRSFDLLVIGGGIVGAGIAEAASAHGLDVALVDKGDFGGATSSASTKLVHGGLRYLRLGDVGLVREAHHERRLLMHVVAPHLVRRLPFLMPLYEDGPYRPWLVQSGILLYSVLARARLNGLVSVDRARRIVPQLRCERLRACALYADAWTNDVRLTLANVRGAADRGATVVNYAEVTAIRGDQGANVVADGREIVVRAREIVNATGPWVDRVRRLEDEQAKPSVRLSKGVHALVEGGDWSAALAIAHDKVRVSFVVPWEGMLLLGTTDTPHEGEPESAAVAEADVAQVMREAAVATDSLGPVRATFCGLRVLPIGASGTVTARRETVFSTGPSGMVSVAGGKLTTYRRIALDALRQLGVRGVSQRPRPLPGAVGLDRIAWPVELDGATRAQLLHLYGSLATEVLEPAAADPSLLEPLVAGGPELRAQALYAHTHEWALTDEDVLRRRTTGWLAAARAQPAAASDQ
jgi:glycerol-3-phosphate dehydrogenase